MIASTNLRAPPARLGQTATADCPSCGYVGALSVTRRRGAVLYYCHAGCGQPDLLDAIRRAGGDPGRLRDRERPTPDRDPGAAALAIWSRTTPGRGTPAELYVRARGIRLDPWPDDLRFSSRLLHVPSASTYPAMVAGVRDAQGRVVAVHRTFLAVDGRGKAPVAPAKMTLGPAAGAAVRLAPAGPRLVVGEGIESTLSAMVGSGLPGWAGLSAGGVRGMALPALPLAGVVTIVADRDPVGIAAAEDAARRWLDEGRQVRIALPPEGFDDWNDAHRAEEVVDVAV